MKMLMLSRVGSIDNAPLRFNGKVIENAGGDSSKLSHLSIYPHLYTNYRVIMVIRVT